MRSNDSVPIARRQSCFYIIDFTNASFFGEEEHEGTIVMVVEVQGKEGEEDQSGGGWITSGTTCRKENYQERKLKTG